MGRKRERNYYPRLPDAEANLLALNGLRAVPVRQEVILRGFKRMHWDVIPDKPGVGPAGSDQPTPFHRGWRPVFEVRMGASLEMWIAKVNLYNQRKEGGPFVGIDFETMEARALRALEQKTIWYSEVGDINAWPLPGGNRPKRP